MGGGKGGGGAPQVIQPPAPALSPAAQALQTSLSNAVQAKMGAYTPFMSQTNAQMYPQTGWGGIMGGMGATGPSMQGGGASGMYNALQQQQQPGAVGANGMNPMGGAFGTMPFGPGGYLSNVPGFGAPATNGFGSTAYNPYGIPNPYTGGGVHPMGHYQGQVGISAQPNAGGQPQQPGQGPQQWKPQIGQPRYG
jgi:hypothetical protein